MYLRRSLGLLFIGIVACSGSTDSPTDGGTNTDAGGGLCLNISGNEEVNGLSIRRPEAEVNGCRETPGDVPEESSCTEVEPDLSCVGNAVPFGTPINVFMTGCVTSFGLEAASDELTVKLFTEDFNGQPTDPGYDLTGASGQQADNTPGALIGETVSTAVSSTTCTDRGRFLIANVPTETQLLARVTDQQQPAGTRQYVDTYQYNIVLRNNELREGPELTDPLVQNPETYCVNNPCYAIDDVNTVVDATFNIVALTAGVSSFEGKDDLFDGVGQGHVAGQVQDCTSLDTMRNAVVSLSVEARKLAYFNVAYDETIANLEDPQVDQSRNRTNADGLYTAIAVDTQPGGAPITVGAAVTTSLCGDDGVCRCENGMDNAAWSAADTNEGNVEVLGTRDVFVFPDSITILTFDRNIYTAP